MIQAKCIQKFRNKHNQIYGYRLQDINGQTQDVTPEDLKRAIQNKQINIINLTLTLDGRLVDKTPEKQLKNMKIMPNKINKPKSEIIKEKLIEKAEYIMHNCKNSPPIYYDEYDSDNMMTTSISENVYTKEDVLLSFWMWIKPESIAFQVAEQIGDDYDEDYEIDFKFYKEIRIDVLNTPNEKLAAIENKYKQEIYNLYKH